jgi:beta-mannosidase
MYPFPFDPPLHLRFPSSAALNISIFGLPACILFILLTVACKRAPVLLSPLELKLHEGWEFTGNNHDGWYPARVPGEIHTDLLAQQLIPDPYFGNNEDSLTWIEQTGWSYRLHFTPPADPNAFERVELHFEGLDTYARIHLNGRELARTDNMFRQWFLDVGKNILSGENLLEVEFTPPLVYHQDALAALPFLLPSGNEAKDIPVKVSAHSRKAAYQFGWDWGPRFVGCGIWRPVRLRMWNKARIQQIHTFTLDLEEEEASMLSRVYIEVASPGRYRIESPYGQAIRRLESGRHHLDIHFRIDQPELWWCAGEGEATMHSQHIRLFAEDQLLEEKEDRFGIRLIQLIHEPDSLGTAFHFILNGRPVFMKGANYIPQDLFPTRVAPAKYNDLIRAAKEAGMNMLRIWGGGIYEDDLFYEICNEEGILLWQDLMFANSMYPPSPDFLENVRQEVIDNVLRLGAHPCIAIWCGNNEIEVAWNNWGWQEAFGYDSRTQDLLWSFYDTLFHQMIPEEIHRLIPLANYTHTSPLSNWGKAENFRHGTMHYWGVWHGKEDFDQFENNVGRFMVEYGFQSFPSLESLTDVIPASELSLYSPAMTQRQKSYIGNRMIVEQIANYGEVPDRFADFVLRSQEIQGKALSIATRAHLQAAPRCMGSLIWQLNDCWPGPSWSLIDYYGRKKASYDSVKTVFTLIHPFGAEQEGVDQ